MISWTPTVLSVLYACVLYFCICTCSVQLSMFHMERRSRNTLIIIIMNHFLVIIGECAEMKLSDNLLSRCYMSLCLSTNVYAFVLS